MRPISVTTGPYAAGAVAGLAASQAPTAGTALTLTGTAIDTPRRLLVTAGADAVTTRTLTLVGTNWSGNAISEVLAIPTGAGATVSALDYKTLTSATPTGTGWSANMSLGTSTSGTNSPMGSSAWVRLDDYGFAPVQLQGDVSGTATLGVEYSDDDPNVLRPQTTIAVAAMTWLQHPTMTNFTTPTADSFPVAPTWVRLTHYSGGGSGSLAVRQPGGKFG